LNRVRQTAGIPAEIGRPRARLEDQRLVTGAGRFVADLHPAACLHVEFLRSPYARGAITTLGIEAAQAAPGVHAVLTGADTRDLGEAAVNRIAPDMHAPPYVILAEREVRAVGQPIAAVIADSVNAARNAIELIDLSIETIPEAPPRTAFARAWRSGDNDAAFAAAHLVVRARVNHARVAPAPLEARAVLADWSQERALLTVWLSTQTPHRARSDLAAILGLDAKQIRVIAPDVGGAFGGKASLYPEEALVAFAAMRLGRPVKWCATRGEDLLAATHGRGASSEGELALAADGRILGLRARLEFPLGHWLPFSAAIPANNAGRILPGPYLVGAVDIAASAKCSDTAAVGIYRGAGRPEAAMLMERLLDQAARALALDPLELRRRNIVKHLPHRTPTGELVDSGDFAALLDHTEARAGYHERLAARDRARADGAICGIGAALYIEPCGQGWESATVTLQPDGAVIAASGSSAQGQGHETAYAQIVADALSIPPEQVLIRHGDTESAPTGIGALASRSIAIGGSAMLQAAEQLRTQALAVAATLLNTAPDRVELDADGFRARDDATRRADWRMIAAQRRLEASVVYHAPGEAWSSGCCIASVAIDRATGVVTVDRIVWTDDAGVIVNKLLAEGQLIGGLAQGLGEALFERLVYDDGQLLTGSLMDYALPRARDMPPVDLESIATPTPMNALGAKGVGEAGCIGVPAAIANAVADALGPFGLTDIDLPLTSEGIWRIIHRQRGDAT
jgi:carbon-monoxide dehydrogenase large subunit